MEIALQVRPTLAKKKHKSKIWTSKRVVYRFVALGSMFTCSRVKLEYTTIKAD